MKLGVPTMAQINRRQNINKNFISMVKEVQ